MEKGNSQRIFPPRKAFASRVSFKILIAFLFFIFSFASPGIAQKGGVYHTVTKGVTLYRISLAYKVSIARLMEANGLSSPSALKMGCKLFIPGAKAVLKVESYIPLSTLERKDLERTLEREEQ